jgi:formylglycine-generating enzyme required for sulfatase activity
VPKKPSKARKGLDPVWDEIVYERCLAADPDDRYASAAELKAAILGRKSETTPKDAPTEDGKPKRGTPPPLSASRKQSASGDKPVSGRNWISPTTGMEFVWIEALKLWVGKYAVTNAEYRKMSPKRNSGSYGRYSLNGDRQPVVKVNFNDARSYAKWLSRMDHAALEGLCYRLPSEDEWSAFAHCEDGREYPWGDGWPPFSGEAGNYADSTLKRLSGFWLYRPSSSVPRYTDGHPVSAPVNEDWVNPWGLYGVGGNVWEACALDRTGQLFGAWRGASWKTGARVFLKCAYRKCWIDKFWSNFKRDDHGFRLVLSENSTSLPDSDGTVGGTRGTRQC